MKSTVKYSKNYSIYSLILALLLSIGVNEASAEVIDNQSKKDAGGLLALTLIEAAKKEGKLPKNAELDYESIKVEPFISATKEVPKKTETDYIAVPFVYMGIAFRAVQDILKTGERDFNILSFKVKIGDRSFESVNFIHFKTSDFECSSQVHKTQGDFLTFKNAKTGETFEGRTVGTLPYFTNDDDLKIKRASS